MNDLTDQQLLREYADRQSEAAFAELVRRRIGLVYSAALRMVCDADLAKDVTQGVFVALAQGARQLTNRPVLSGWLHRTAQNLAAKAIRTDVRRRAREQEAAAMNELLSTEPDAIWEYIAPRLDAALGELSEPDRDALLLRYFEGRSAREMAQTLGISDDAAQKRVSRAVERLREFFAKRGVTVAANGLAVVISDNAVQAAPAGLAGTVSAAAVLDASAVHTPTLIATTKTIAMTMLQKTVVTAALAVVAGAGIYETRQNSALREQNQALQQRQAPLAEQVQQLQSEHDEAVRQLASLSEDNARLNRNAAELPRLRNEVAQLKHEQATARTGASLPSSAIETAAGKKQTLEDIGRELGMAVVKGDPTAMDKILALSKTEHESFNTNRAGLDDSQQGELSRETFAPLRAAFDVISQAGSKGNQFALDALARALPIPELNGVAVKSLGVLAGNGDEGALEVLLHPEKYGALLSSSIGALQPAADSGNQKAIDALAAVTRDTANRALWFMAADGLNNAAGAGNAVAIDALAGLLASTNQNVQNQAITGLKMAAANQNAKAAEALRSVGIQ